ncbi:hypothetical protein [Cellulosimicrobium cellulans]|uniref:hypothetical protein n=1 Tax=Cellulosimicrobium cellulans TaxID=1710 RepID=UPI002405EAB8|nr:hypothetical protein [Cellulosimicrobium cellulans]MDF9874813.1 hypothetical protein [Cellulosimicrobium cellulans]
MTTQTTDQATAHLPAGYDDETNRWYIDPDLRPHYVPPTRHELRTFYGDVMTANDRAGYGDRVITREAYEWATWTMKRSGEWARYDGKRDEERGFHTPERVDERNLRRVDLAAAMTEEDEAYWYHVRRALPEAQFRLTTALKIAEAREQRRAERTCAVCDEYQETTRTVFVNVERGTVLDRHDPQHRNAAPGTDRAVKACIPCSLHLAQVIADDQVNGQPRRDVVRAWFERTYVDEE